MITALPLPAYGRGQMEAPRVWRLVATTPWRPYMCCWSETVGRSIYPLGCFFRYLMAVACVTYRTAIFCTILNMPPPLSVQLKICPPPVCYVGGLSHVNIFICVMCSFLLVDCADSWHVTRSARRGRFAPAGLSSRAASGPVIVQNSPTHPINK